ncbi:TolC family protein [Allorhodopirellula solitaria]|uniref:Cation efflux system protein CusC n=1 Tax=Allorhodopirellula solitaria TaxID=2527987 RepID=A0A5C5YF07_9BACT|nr:TolC family protein [Allorhodopirellula solitaria]TWT73890.1 Cation efflux system protein CusC precursor [Allorhodopirellula solitaria]
MNTFLRFTITRRRRIAITTAIVSGSLVVLPSCNIPCLRRPQTQAPLPQAYPAGNNGVVSADNDGGEIYDVPIQVQDPLTQSSAQPADFNEHVVATKDSDSSVSFASFLKNGDELDLRRDAPTTDTVESPAEVVIDSYDEVVIDSYESTSSLDPTLTEVAVAPAEVYPAPIDGAATELVFDEMSMDFGPSSLQNSSMLGWHEFFADANLSDLIGQAMLGNQELKILAEDIQIAHNEVYKRSGEYLPFVTLGGGVGVDKPSLFSARGTVEDQLSPVPGVNFPDPLPDFLLATNVSWEIDIWNKLHNAQYAACMRYLGTRDGWNYVVTRMVSEVAENYYELMALDNQMATLDATIRLQERSLETAKAMKEQARGNELAVQRFQAEVQKNQSEKLIISQQIVEAENRINFLLGRYPQPVKRSSIDYIDLNMQTLNIGVPSELLRNRSDIRQAERELRAAGLDVKVARARFYPSLTLTAGVGYQAFNPRYMFWTPEALIYRLAGDLVGPLINKRAIQADYKDANAEQLQAVYSYQRTILEAFIEVTNHMAKVENYRKSIIEKKEQLDALVASIDSATLLFQNAEGEYLDVLLAQRDMNEAKMVLIDTKQEQLSAVVNAYQALGGGGVLAGYQ